MIAKEVKKIEGWQGDARLYEMIPPYEDNKFVILSAVNNGYVHETYIFPADESGKILDWMELSGSKRGTTDHNEILSDIGYVRE